MNKKDNIFSRFNLNTKNLNMELEAVLDEKNFSENVQGLILGIFYKIENAYEDYYNVKRKMPTKEIFIQTIINVIKSYCNEIEIIKPKGTKNESSYKTNIETGSLKCFANEETLLLGLFQLIKVEFKEDELLEQALLEILKYGNSLNYQEVIRAFNGWSWKDTLSSVYDIQCNLIYQNLLIILGNDKLQEIFISKDRKSEIEKNLEKNYNKELVKGFIFYLLQIGVILKMNKNKEYKMKLEEYFAQINDELQKLDNKEEYLNYTTNKRREITNQIGKIDKKLNNIKYLKEDFEERNNKLERGKKIFSVSNLADMYEEERKKLLKKLKECNKSVEPKEYINKKVELQNKVDFCKKINLQLEQKDNVEKVIIEFQKIFLKCFEEKINQCKDKKEIVNLIYNLRYYWILNYKKGYKIKDSIKLKEILENVLKELVNKAEDLKAIEKFSRDNLSNLIIIKKILTNEVISLENVMVQISDLDEKNGKYRVQYFDGAMLQKEIEINLKDVINKKKKLRLFI